MKTSEISKSVNEFVEMINSVPAKSKRKIMDEVEKSFKSVVLENGDTVDGFVYLTGDLEQFKTVLGNRIINENTTYIKQLGESIKKHGNISPIVINSKRETIDGQRRLTSVKMSEDLENKQIRYIKVEGTDIDTVGDINRLQIKWNYKDWMNKYVSMENQEYIDYQALEEKYYPIMKPRSLRSLIMNNRVGPFSTAAWESGDFTIDREHLENNIKFLEFLTQIAEMGTNNIFAKNRDFQNALHQIYKNIDLFDEDRLMHRIRLGFVKLNIKTGLDGYKKILAELYDAKLPKKEPHVEALFSEEGKLQTA